MPQERPVVLDDGLEIFAGDRRLGETRLQPGVFLGRAGFLHAVILGLLVGLIGIEKSRRRKEQAEPECRRSGGKQGHARAPQMIKAPQAVVGILFAGRVRGEHVQEQAFCERPGRRRFEAQGVGDPVEVVNMELQPGGIDADRVVERFVLARREDQHVERGRLARQDAGVDEILLDPQRLGREILRNRSGIGEVHAAEAREADSAVLDVALPQSGLLPAHYQVSPTLETEALPRLGRHGRHRKHADQAGFMRAQGLQPGLELMRVGKRHVENPFLAPARVGLGPERERQSEGRVAVALGELARKQRPAVRAAHVRDVFLKEIFFDHVGEHVEKAFRGAGHISREFGDAFLVHVEDAFLLQLASFP